MQKRITSLRTTVTTFVVLMLVAAVLVTGNNHLLVPAAHGQSAGRSFTFLQPAYAQEIFGVSGHFMGGVAFAPDGDAWVTDCEFVGNELHRYDLQATAPDVNSTTFHPESIVPSIVGCGITNHPNGRMYSNIDDGTNGVSELDVNTGAPFRTFGPRGNALGIAVDPQTNHLVYPGEDCNRYSGQCTIYDIDPVSGASSTFVVLGGADSEYVDGLFFDPSGDFLFLANRQPSNRLTILNRGGAVLQHIPMNSEPDGIAFHETTPKFVISNNIDGTITRFDFANDDYTQTPTSTLFASGGFRGDLTQVGADGCLYLTQDGTRYNDGTDASQNSLVRICGGFAPPPGVRRVTGALGDTVWYDTNGSGAQESGEPGIASVTVKLLDASGNVSATTATDADGHYAFGNLPAATYTVRVDPATLPANVIETYDLDGTSTPHQATVALAPGETNNNVDFGYNAPCAARIGDFVWYDQNLDGLQNNNEPGLGGVTLRLKNSQGALLATATSGANGFYQFMGLCAGSYTVEVDSASVPAGFVPTLNQVGSNRAVDSNMNPSSVVLVADNSSEQSVDFGYVMGQQLCPPSGSGGTGAAGMIYWGIDVNGDVSVRYEQSRAVNDNTYGTNAVGWTNGHKFSDLTGSDKAEFKFTDANGQLVLDFYFDYITYVGVTAATPSGYKSLGPDGGDGSFVSGTRSNILSFTTSFARNLNEQGFCANGACTVNGVNLLSTSPAADANYNPIDPTFSKWNFTNWFEMKISRAAFGSAGFGGVAVGLIHNSPAKSGSNAFAPTPCVPAGNPPPPGACNIAAAPATFGKDQVKWKLTNNGSTTVTLSGLNFTWPQMINGKLSRVKIGKDMLFGGPPVSSPATLTSANFGPDVKKRSLKPGETSEFVLEFERNVSANPAGYTGSLQFGQGCSVPFK